MKIILELIFAAATLISALGVVVLVNQANLGAFALHPTLAVAGFFTMLWSSFLMAREPNAKKRSASALYHQIVMYAAASAVVYGNYAMFSAKEAHGKQHFRTPHAYLGAFATFVMLLPTVFATIEGISPTKNVKKRIESWQMHKRVGKIAGGLMAAAVFTGMHVLFDEDAAMANVVGGAAILSVVMLALRARATKKAGVSADKLN